jgi:O-methyltransferase
MHGSERKLHLYDSFDTKFTIKGNVEDVLHKNFFDAGLTQPILHKGYFDQTIPDQLPEHISFVHIDCGFGGDPLAHRDVILYCLESIYPRMSKNAVCVLMDYHDRSSSNKSYDVNPGVKLAADEFLSAKQEKIISLYGNQYAHGFFRKV